MIPDKSTKKKPSVSLVLGSGGARGYAHIGVIQWLTENELRIESISGSSMGALIGGIYAAGKLDAYTNWVRALGGKEVLRLLDFAFGSPGLIRGEKIMNVLRELIGDCNIEDLPISFTAVATDIHAGKGVWLSEGPLFDAIRASIAFPTLFTPFSHQGKTLMDGGLLNPIPIAPTVRDHTDMTIAVNLSAKGKVPEIRGQQRTRPSNGWRRYHTDILNFIGDLQYKKISDEAEGMSFFDVVSQSIDTMQTTIARFKLAAHTPDVTIDIPKSCGTFLEFERAEELIRIGYHIAGKAIEAYLDKNGFND